MYYYNDYTVYNYTAGVLGILVLAVVITALLVALVLPKHKDGKLSAFLQLLYDLFTPKTLMIEKLLQVIYVFLTCLTVLYGVVVFFNGFFAGFGRIVLGLVILVVGPILLRVFYELLLLAVMQVKTTREISQKLDRIMPDEARREPPQGPARGPHRPAGGPPPAGGGPGHAPLPRLRHLVPGGGGPLPHLRPAGRAVNGALSCLEHGKTLPRGFGLRGSVLSHLGLHQKMGRAGAAGDLHLPQAPGQAHGLAAGGALEVVVLGVGLDLLPPVEPAEDRLDQGQEAGVLHLALLLVLGQQPDDQVNQHHRGGDPQGEEEAPQGGQDQKQEQPEQAVQVKARVALEEGFLGCCHGGRLLAVGVVTLLYSLWGDSQGGTPGPQGRAGTKPLLFSPDCSKIRGYSTCVSR